jgi:uncharacterized hydrophobic protein (TIGR00271 family)
MNAITLLFDPEQEQVVREKFLPRLAEHTVVAVAFEGTLPEAAGPETTLLTYLSDAMLKPLVPEILLRKCRLALLPHSDMKHAQIGYGIASRWEDALDDVIAAEDSVEVDLLYCNGQPVFNSVVIGDPFTLTPGTAATEGVWARLRRFARLIATLGKITLHPFKLSTQKERILDTAALGIVVVEHGRSSVMARRIIGDSAVNDGMLHALVLAPRSVLEMAWFLLRSLVLRGIGRDGRLPAFIGHIRTEALRIESPKAVGYAVDGVSDSTQAIELNVAARALKVIPGRNLQVDKGAEAKEVFRVQGLPTGEAVTSLVSKPLPWIHHAATEEFRELFQMLRENARVSESYLILIMLSTLLATIGLFANSTPVIIGAMILAPLMAPIISLSMGVLRRQEYLLIESAKSLGWGVLLALACATLLTWIMPLHTINSEISARLSPTLLDLGVAVISGIAGAYAHARAEIARSLAGVAIAVALVPPLSVAGIGIGWGEWPVFWGAFLLFLTNLVGIVLAAAFTFLLLGYSPFGRAKRGLVLSMILAGIVSVPLAMGFFRMVDEHRIVLTLEGWESEGVQLRDVKIRSVKPLYLSARLLAGQPVDSARIDRVKQDIEALLRREITLEATVAVVR